MRRCVPPQACPGALLPAPAVISRTCQQRPPQRASVAVLPRHVGSLAVRAAVRAVRTVRAVRCSVYGRSRGHSLRSMPSTRRAGAVSQHEAPGHRAAEASTGRCARPCKSPYGPSPCRANVVQGGETVRWPRVCAEPKRRSEWPAPCTRRHQSAVMSHSLEPKAESAANQPRVSRTTRPS